ncbi:type II toxin-antitoxin system CcdA family antitoxin [Sulfuricurvum sp.]
MAETIASQKESVWIKENKEAIEEYNNRVSKNGTFSDRLRRF